MLFIFVLAFMIVGYILGKCQGIVEGYTAGERDRQRKDILIVREGLDDVLFLVDGKCEMDWLELYSNIMDKLKKP